MSTAFHVTKVFHELMVHVNEQVNVQQTMFCGRKTKRHQEVKDGPCYRVISKPVVRKVDSVLFKTRIKRQYKVLLNEIDPNEIDIVHAHFLFTDGALALRLYREFNVPFVVSVRNTDVNIYFKYFPHLRRLASEIIAAAEKVIFVAPTHKDKVVKYLSPKAKSVLLSKVAIVPNGVNSYWIENIAEAKQGISTDGLDFLYVGSLDKNKNVSRLVRTLDEARVKNGGKISLKVVGPPGDDFSSFLRLSKKRDWVEYLGKVSDPQELQKLYRRADFFIMLSSRETFGLVYIEAMTQGTPVVFTKGQGIDGYFTEKTIGVPFTLGVDNGASMLEKIRHLQEKYAETSANCIEASRHFSWERFGAYYAELYISILESIN
jgi:glycosyltransferase involved in cell wall biosynthesis